MKNWLVIGFVFFVVNAAVAAITISPESRTFSWEGGGGGVLTAGDGVWTASTTCDWISVAPNTSGNAGESVAYVVAESALVETRVGTVSVNGNVHTVTQTGRVSSISPREIPVGCDGGSEEVVVIVESGVSWSAKSNADWIEVSASEGVGSKALSFEVAPNFGLMPRSGTMTVAGKLVTVSQEGIDLTLSTYDEILDCDSHTIYLTVSALSTTSWSVMPDVDWIVVTKNMTGKGGATATLKISENPNYHIRTGKVTVGSKVLYVEQHGVRDFSLSINPTNTVAAAEGVYGNVAVTTLPADLPWTAKSESPWIVLSDGMSGAGKGCSWYVVPPNPTLSNRVGRISYGFEQPYTSLKEGLVFWKGCDLNGGTNEIPLHLGYDCAGRTDNILLCWESESPRGDLLKLSNDGLIKIDRYGRLVYEVAGIANVLDRIIETNVKYHVTVSGDAAGSSIFLSNVGENGDCHKLMEFSEYVCVSAIKNSTCKEYHSWNRALSQKEVRDISLMDIFQREQMDPVYDKLSQYMDMSTLGMYDLVKTNVCLTMKDDSQLRYVADRNGVANSAVNQNVEHRDLEGFDVYSAYAYKYPTGYYVKDVRLDNIETNDAVSAYIRRYWAARTYNFWIRDLSASADKDIFAFATIGKGYTEYVDRGYTTEQDSPFSRGTWTEIKCLDYYRNIYVGYYTSLKNGSYYPLEPDTRCPVLRNYLSVRAGLLEVNGKQFAVNAKKEWNMITVVCDLQGGKIKISINAEKVATVQSQETRLLDWWKLYGQNFPVDEMEVFDEAITDNEIAALYTAKCPLERVSHVVNQGAFVPELSIERVLAPACGGAYAVSVSTAENVAWGALSNDPWITITSETSFTTPGTVSFVVDSNPSFCCRTGTVVVAGKEVKVIQDAYGFSVEGDPNEFDAEGDSGVLFVDTDGPIDWTAISGADWITIGPDVEGCGSGYFEFDVAAFDVIGGSRVGWIDVNGKRAYIMQYGHKPTEEILSLSPKAINATAASGTYSVAVDLKVPMDWVVENTNNWIVVSSATNFSDSGMVVLTLDENFSDEARTAFVTVAGVDIVVSQEKWGIALSYSSGVFDTDGGMTKVDVDVEKDGGWIATVDPSCTSWVTILDEAQGRGAGSFRFVVSPFASKGVSRIGRIFVNGQPLFIAQCGYAMSVIPAAQTVGPSSVNGMVSVVAPDGNTWSAVATVPWIIILSGETCVGSGTLEFKVLNNETGVSRTGKILIGGMEHVITQTNLQTEPIPDIGKNPTEEQIADALEDSVDEKLASNITDGETYNDFRDWAETIGPQTVKESSNAWMSFALGQDALLDEAPTDEDLSIEAFEPAAVDGKFDFTVSIKDIEVGSEAAAENLKKVFGLEGGSSLQGLSSDNVDITFGTPEDGKVKFTAGPNAANADATTFFMKVKLAP